MAPAAQSIADNAVLRRVGLGVAALAAEADRASVSFSQAVAHAVAIGFWRATVIQAGGVAADFPAARWPNNDLPVETRHRLSGLGAELALLRVEGAIAEVGRIYTRLLPPAHRKLHGIYYTPQSLTQRLIDDATRAGMDWLHGKAISPSCGGGAFLRNVHRSLHPVGQAKRRHRRPADAHKLASRQLFRCLASHTSERGPACFHGPRRDPKGRFRRCPSGSEPQLLRPRPGAGPGGMFCHSR